MADGARPQPLQQRTLLIRRGDTEVRSRFSWIARIG